MFLLITGEIDAEIRLPIIQKGIIYQLSKAFGGMSVMIEHRYFGKSIPTPDLSTENLRFCTTTQALADVVYFSQNIVFKGHESDNLTSTAVPWITYGGSYSGAFVAFLRTLYPGCFWGSISSSGVTAAILEFWQYYEPIRMYGPSTCISLTQKLTNAIDNILLGKGNGWQGWHGHGADQGNFLTTQLKNAFGLGNMTYSDDFAMTIATSLGGWQSRNWDPSVDDPTFYQYCNNLTANTTLYPVSDQQRKHTAQLLAAGGYGDQAPELTTPLLNWMGYTNVTYAIPCTSDNQTLDECYSQHSQPYYHATDQSQTDRSWPYMYCTQWGFLQTGSGVPPDQLPLISRTITLDYTTLVCREAFNITTLPDVQAINQYGGFGIASPRLAIVGGEADPWRGATPVADSLAPWSNRPNTTEQPFLLISGAVHHWDENGVFPNETTPDLPPRPERIANAQEHGFVMAWLKEAEGVFPAFVLHA